jgi:hypothetical protein
VEDDDAYALQRRVIEQGWDQGALLNIRERLYLADADRPITLAASTAASGDHGVIVVRNQVPTREQHGAVIATQLCDLVAFPPLEPLVEALPVTVWPDGKALPSPNSARVFVLDPDKRLVADARYRLSFEKSLLPDRPATLTIDSDDRRRSFAAWCARRYSRHPFPDDFVETVAAALEHAFTAPTRRDSPAAHSMYLWRVRFAAGDPRQVLFLVPFDEDRVSKAEVTELVGELVERTRARLPTTLKKARERWAKQGRNPDDIRQFDINVMVVPSGQLNLRDMRQAPPLNLEHLTYRGEGVYGVEPHIELDD